MCVKAGASLLLFTIDHLQHIEALIDLKVERVVDVQSQINPEQPLVPQVVALTDKAGLSATEWQTLPLLVNPPSLNFVAAALLAELHGHCGYFPAHLRLRPVEGSITPRFEIAEVLDLQSARNGARGRGR